MHNFFDTEAVYQEFLRAYRKSLDTFCGSTLAAMFADAEQNRQWGLLFMIADVGKVNCGNDWEKEVTAAYARLP